MKHYYSYEEMPTRQIGVDCTAEQRKFLIASIDHIEAFTTDKHRVRFHFKDGTVGPWFSREWPLLTFANVAEPRTKE